MKMKTGPKECGNVGGHVGPWSSIPHRGDPASCAAKRERVPSALWSAAARIIVETWLLLAARLIRPVYAT